LALKQIENGIHHAGTILAFIGGVMFLALMFLGTGDVIGRYLFNHPIRGTYEISEVLMAGLILLSLAYTQRKGGHVTVELLVSRYPPRAKAIANFVTLLVSLVLFSVITRQSAILAVNYVQEHRIFQTIPLPTGPFHFFVPVGAFFLCLEFIIQMFQLVPRMRKV
jgi:TRAP-type C4-dicarboxylate transport system permease small subunit